MIINLVSIDIFREVNMDWEFVVLEKLQQLHSAPLDFIMKCFAPFWLVIIFIALPSLIVMITKKHAKLGRMLASSAAVCGLTCALIIKPVVSRLRPYELNTTIAMLVPPEIDASFPSGHTCFAFSAATVCFIYNKKLGIMMYVFASIIAFSRLYLYMHFPTDVLCGALLGIICGIVGVYIESILFLPKKPAALIKQPA